MLRQVFLVSPRNQTETCLMYRQQNNNMYFQQNLKDTISVPDHAMVCTDSTGPNHNWEDQVVNLYINILPQQL